MKLLNWTEISEMAEGLSGDHFSCIQMRAYEIWINFNFNPRVIRTRTAPQKQNSDV